MLIEWHVQLWFDQPWASSVQVPLNKQSMSVLREPVSKFLTVPGLWVLQDGGQKVNSIFERARALGATEGSIADLQQPSSSGTKLAGPVRSCLVLLVLGTPHAHQIWLAYLSSRCLGLRQDGLNFCPVY